MLFYLSSRFGDEALLTVSASPHDQKTVRVNGSSAGGNKMLQLTNQSAIYLGGLPDNLTVTITNICNQFRNLSQLSYYSSTQPK